MTPRERQQYVEALERWKSEHLTPEDTKQKAFIRYYDALKVVGRAALDKEPVETFLPKVDRLNKAVLKL